MLLLLLLLLLSSSSSSSSKQPVSYTMLGPTVIVLVSEVSKAVLAWENSQNFMTPLLDSLRNQWCLRNERRNSTLMVHHHPELVSASDWLCCSRKLLQTIRSTTQIWGTFLRHHFAGALQNAGCFLRLRWSLCIVFWTDFLLSW